MRWLDTVALTLLFFFHRQLCARGSCGSTRGPATCASQCESNRGWDVRVAEAERCMAGGQGIDKRARPDKCALHNVPLDAPRSSINRVDQCAVEPRIFNKDALGVVCAILLCFLRLAAWGHQKAVLRDRRPYR